MINRDTITERLKKVIDPETEMDIMAMGLIREIKIHPAGGLKIVFRPSSHLCPLAYHLAFQIQKELQWIPGVGKVDLSVTDFAGAKDLNRMLRAEERQSQDLETPEKIQAGKEIKGRKCGIAGKMIGWLSGERKGA